MTLAVQPRYHDNENHGMAGTCPPMQNAHIILSAGFYVLTPYTTSMMVLGFTCPCGAMPVISMVRWRKGPVALSQVGDRA